MGQTFFNQQGTGNSVESRLALARVSPSTPPWNFFMKNQHGTKTHPQPNPHLTPTQPPPKPTRRGGAPSPSYLTSARLPPTSEVPCSYRPSSRIPSAPVGSRPGQRDALDDNACFLRWRQKTRGRQRAPMLRHSTTLAVCGALRRHEFIPIEDLGKLRSSVHCRHRKGGDGLVAIADAGL